MVAPQTIPDKFKEDDESSSSSNSEAAKSESRAQKIIKKAQELGVSSRQTLNSVEKDNQNKWRWYDRGVKRRNSARGLVQSKKDAKSCFERARKVGAKFTGKYIAADEKIESFDLDYDGKRDGWNGYDTSQYCRVQDKKFEEKRMARLDYLMKLKPEDKSCREEDDPNASEVNYVPAVPKSKWEEDIYVNNHTSVWGSYRENHQWGYKCCLQTDKQSFCTA